MKRKNLKYHWNVTAMVISAIAMMVALFFCFSLVYNINRQMNESATTNLFNTTQVIKGNFENYIEKDFESLNIIGQLYKQNVELDGEVFDSLCKTMGFEWVLVVEEDNQTEKELGMNALKEKPWFKEWKWGEPGYSHTYYGDSGRLQTTLWFPVYEDDKLICTVFGEVLLTKYYSAKVFTFYEGNGRTYLFNRTDGSWILKSLGLDGLNRRQEDIYSLLLESQNPPEEIEAFREAVEKCQTGTAVFNFNGELSYICFMPLSSSSDWYLTTVIAKDVLLKESNQVQRMIQLILLVFCCVILVFAVALIKWQNRQTKLKEANYREALFANISSNIDSVFLIYDKEKKENVFVSDNIKRILGLERDWIRQNAENLFDWCGIEKGDSLRNTFLDGTLHNPMAREVCMENGVGVKSRYIRLELIPADLGQEIAVLSDITKDKDIQNSLMETMKQAESASRAKNDFLSAMSHDLRTPLNGVTGMTAIASAHLDDKNRVKDCLNKINEASAHLLNLINEILDMSRIESGKMELSEEPFNLPQLIQEVLSMNLPGIRQKQHKISVHIHSMDHEQVLGDPVRMQRIAANLLSNAIKYTPEGGKISLTLLEKPSAINNYGCYEITVQDNGIGMSEEFQEKLFQPFEREEDVRLKKIQGTGLGMSIIKSIIDLMLGDITVESEKNKGTTFRVTINLKLDECEGFLNKKLDKIPILVVDDDMTICETVTIMLTDIGMTAEWANNGKTAIKMVSERHRNTADYMAVLLDWKMPDMDGVETARKIREEVDSKVPIIILTAYDWSEIEAEAKAAGVDAFLSKPVYKSKLMKKMLTLIDQPTLEKVTFEEIKKREIPAGKRILLAEDNQLNSEIAVEMLEMMKLKVDTVEDGVKAVECFENSDPGRYHLILMDIQMPKMNGYEAARAIRALNHPDSKTIPIVAMTADAFAKDIQAAYSAGMNEHLSKPVSVKRLVDVMERFLTDSSQKNEEKGDIQ